MTTVIALLPLVPWCFGSASSQCKWVAVAQLGGTGSRQEVLLIFPSHLHKKRDSVMSPIGQMSPRDGTAVVLMSRE